MTALDMNNDAALDGYPPLLRHILSGQEFGPLIRSPDRPKHRAAWRDLIRAMTHLPPASEHLAERHQEVLPHAVVAGHSRIRSQCSQRMHQGTDHLDDGDAAYNFVAFARI